MSDSADAERQLLRQWCASKGFGIGALVGQGSRFHASASGDVWLAYSVRCDATDDLEAGTVVGVKLRSVRTGAKRCITGTRLSYPALPSLYGPSDPTAVYIGEGESDAAWLFDQRESDTEAVLCLHGGAGLWSPRWAECIPAGAAVYVCTDNDYDRPRDHAGVENIGEHLALRIIADVPGAKRLRPPRPARDWCEVEVPA